MGVVSQPVLSGKGEVSVGWSMAPGWSWLDYAPESWDTLYCRWLGYTDSRFSQRPKAAVRLNGSMGSRDSGSFDWVTCRARSFEGRMNRIFDGRFGATPDTAAKGDGS